MDFESLFNQKLEYTIELGVVDGEHKPEEEEKNGNKRKKKKAAGEKKGITNAELMFILENGSPIRDIPPRPVLQKTIDFANEALIDNMMDKGYEEYLRGGQAAMEKELNRWCDRIREYAQDMIYDSDSNGMLEPNKPSTIKRKGFNHPLFVTGELARSITCILVNEKGEKV